MDLFPAGKVSSYQYDLIARLNIQSSEILAQLNLPNSGISLYRDDVLLPSGRFTLNQRDITTVTRMMSLYSAQIFLQKTLYHVHTELYKVEGRISTDVG